MHRLNVIVSFSSDDEERESDEERRSDEEMDVDDLAITEGEQISVEDLPAWFTQGSYQRNPSRSKKEPLLLDDRDLRAKLFDIDVLQLVRADLYAAAVTIIDSQEN